MVKYDETQTIIYGYLKRKAYDFHIYVQYPLAKVTVYILNNISYYPFYFNYCIAMQYSSSNCSLTTSIKWTTSMWEISWLIPLIRDRNTTKRKISYPEGIGRVKRETENPNIKATKLEIKYVLEFWTKISVQ